MSESRNAEAAAAAEPAAPQADLAAAKPAGDQIAPDATAATPEALIRHGIRFECVTDAAYHARREASLAFAHRLIMAIVLVAGTASFADIARSVEDGRQWAALIVVIASTVSLVFDFSGRARLHSQFRVRFRGILAKLATCSESDLGAIRAELEGLYAEEPPVRRSVQLLAYNAAVEALYAPDAAKEYFTPVGCLDRIAARMP